MMTMKPISIAFYTRYSSRIFSSFFNGWYRHDLHQHHQSCLPPIRSMAYVSNKRITRLPSDTQVERAELNQTGNESYLDVRLRNRNPRNLEQMLMEPKPMGYEMDLPNRHYWNKVVFEKKSRHLAGRIVHHSGRTVVSAATNEPAVAVFLGNRGSQFDIKAATILGQVLAMRALESGIHSVFCDVDHSAGGKVQSFLQALMKNGLNLDESPVIHPRSQRDL